MYEIKDKVFVVTGGAIGIGSLVVQMAVVENAKHVAILDVDVTNGTALEKELNTKYGANKVKFYKCDVTSKELHDAYDDVFKSQGYIDVVVNNAGIMNDRTYEKQIAINFTALVTSTLKAFDLMSKDRGGRGGTVVNISSAVALVQGIYLPIYSATKSAVLQFSTSLGNEVYYERSGVRVLTLCYSATTTSLFDKAKLEGFDEEATKFVFNRPLIYQKPESAARATIFAIKHGKSGSTWLSAYDKEPEDITGHVEESFAALSASYKP